MVRNINEDNNDDSKGNLKTFILVAVGVMVLVVLLFVLLGNPSVDNRTSSTPVSAPGTSAPASPAR